MSDTPRTNVARIKSLGKHWWKSFAIMAEHAEQLERENTALRAHAERLAEALANAQYGCDDECIECGHTQCCDAECTINNALTLYRAEYPKV